MTITTLIKYNYNNQNKNNDGDFFGASSLSIIGHISNNCPCYFHNTNINNNMIVDKHRCVKIV